MSVLFSKKISRERLKSLDDSNICYHTLEMIELVDIKSDFNINSSYNIAIFTSANAVKKFFETYKTTIDEVYCVGNETLGELEKYAIKTTMKFNYGHELLQYLSYLDCSDMSVVFPGAANKSIDISVVDFAKVHILDIYETRQIKYPIGYLDAFIKCNNIDSVVFFSPSSVRSYIDNAGITDGISFFSIGETTSKELLNSGVCSIVAAKPDLEIVLMNILDYYLNNSDGGNV